IAPFKYDLVANDITGIYAIINGTTNYILTRMAREGIDFPAALKSAQDLGYAEANPVNDIEGIDANYKLAIMASLAFQAVVKPEDIYREGISRIGSRDFRYARELGFAIKLLAIAKRVDNSIEARVHPVLIPEDSLLAKVDGVYNGILVEGDLIGKVLFYGQGAGPLATSSAVVADVVASAQDITFNVGNRLKWKPDSGKKIKPMDEIETQYYLRMNCADRPGVLARISRILGDNMISIASAIQKEADATLQTAEIVLTTHPSSEKAMRQALRQIEQLEVLKEISNFIRVEHI
ncbi:MAG: homoserine dehydrogenase, partial [Anaerolineales bacterium]|nr:homoserine dehydrogenase [Anaerolineales bacterium]